MFALLSQIINELGPWLWMLTAFALMSIEIFSGRGIALSLALGAITAGTLAIFGASGISPATSDLTQILVFACSAFIIFISIKTKLKLA